MLKDKLYDRTDDALAGRLGRECLRYMYRLLFLFYIEARPDLGYAPMDSETYRKGYSLEHLRDLELVRLTSEESLDGYYLHHAVHTLFGLIRDGFDGTRAGGAVDLLATAKETHLHHGFRIRGLDSALFREGSTPLLDRVKLRNRVLQQVIRLMSLTRPAKGRRGRRGRISYAQLGINQLGAVYEALLSYRGFFAEEDLYEVKKAGESRRPAQERLVRAGARSGRLQGGGTSLRSRRARVTGSSASIAGAASSTASPAGTGRSRRATTRRNRSPVASSSTPCAS